jgi:hypothetical protein
MLTLEFAICGEAYRQVITWRTEAEMAIIRFALETKGKIPVIFRGNRMLRMQIITELPEPGVCEPYVGSSGGANTYCLHPLLKGGCELKAYRNSNGPFSGYPLQISPFNLLSPSCNARWGNAEMGGTSGRFISHIDSEEYQPDQLSFRICEKEMDRFLRFAQGQLALNLYEFIFIPLSVGMEISLRRLSDGTERCLTSRTNW